MVLNDETSIEPILEMVLSPPIKAGIHRTQLADHGIRLQPDVVYEWFISVVVGTDNPSQSIVAGGAISYVEPDHTWAQTVNRALKDASDPAIAWRLYAESGFWYDALADVSQRIRQAPQVTAWLKQRAILLKEVSLSEIPVDAKLHP
ncbi:hypothetical protein C2W62_22420 [Candidatus Entotheonella serta]|nr:hypothetical protein C2W62_22420 [Candidatus Entotheonella serta]